MSRNGKDTDGDSATQTAPSNLLNARRLYKYSTAVVVDWLAANGALKAGKAGAKAGSKR